MIVKIKDIKIHTKIKFKLGVLMATLLTRNEEKSRELTETLSKTLFRSPEDFIKAYSEGWINRNNEEVKNIAQEISDVYQNVQLKNREFVFISQTEAMVEEVITGLHPWKAITKIKRAVKDTVSEEKHGDTLYFLTENDAGYIFYENAESEYVKLTNEKFFKNNDELKPIYAKYSSFASGNPEPESQESNQERKVESNDNPFLEEDDESIQTDDENTREDKEIVVYAFKVDDFTNIDETFIETIYSLFAENA